MSSIGAKVWCGANDAHASDEKCLDAEVKMGFARERLPPATHGCHKPDILPASDAEAYGLRWDA